MSRTKNPNVPSLRKRILIVEDQFPIAFETALTLDDAGYEVVNLTADAGEAQRIADETRPDLIIMDVGLTDDGDGIAAARILRARWGIPTIFVTGRCDPDTLARARAAQPAAYLTKPCSPQQLLSAIQIAIGEA